MLLKAARQWVGCPLGLNILLSLLKEDTPAMRKYLQIAKLMKRTEICSVKTKLFVSSSCKTQDNLKNLIQMSEVEETDFTNKENAFNLWANTNGDFKDVTKEISSKTEFVLANITFFQSDWSSCFNSGPMMTIYNSFNYTQDVKYEARVNMFFCSTTDATKHTASLMLLELPLKSQMKLVVLVPNEVDVLQCLFKTLTSQGFDAAVRSIQPLFTTTCELNPPNVNVTSRIVCENSSSFANCSTKQHGGLIVNKQGITVKVLTCMYCPSNSTDTVDKHLEVDQPFYLAVVYQDMPLFVGQFIQ